MRFDVLGMSDSAHHAERRCKLRIERGQFGPVAAGAVDGARRKHAAFVHHLHGWSSVLVGNGEDHLAFAHNRVDVKDVAGHELFQQEVALAVAQIVECAPQLVRLVDLADTQRRSLRARLEQPRPWHVIHVGTQFVVVQDAAELGNQKAGLLRANAHGQLVAIVGGSCDAHAADAHVFANLRAGLEIELVQGNDAVVAASAGHPGHGVENLLAAQAGRHGDQLLQRLARPGCVAQLVQGEHCGLHAHLRTLAQEVMTFFVAGNTEKPFGGVDHRTLALWNPSSRLGLRVRIVLP